MSGSSHTILFDGREVLSFSDERFSSGYAGLSSSGSGKNTFSSVQVDPVE